MKHLYTLTALILLQQSAFAQVQFTASILKGCEPLIVNFTSSSPGAVKWFWDFGNGNSSTLEKPSTAFFAGTYNISLSVWDKDGKLIGKEIKSNLIQAFKGPSVSFKSNIQKICPEDEVIFTAQAAAPGSTYNWDFGDGSTGSGTTINHVYKTAGLYNVSLQITDPNGCSKSLTLSNYINVSNAATLSINFPDILCKIPAQVSFTVNGNGPYNTWKWEFGDGGTASTMNSNHTYNAFGEYTVRLHATVNGKCPFKEVKTLKILDLSKARLVVNHKSLCIDQELEFTILDASGVQIVDWDFGDGQKRQSGLSTTYAYGKAGKYKVTANLKLKDCIQPVSIEVEIVNLQPPIVSGSVKQLGFCFPMELALVDSNYGISHYWIQQQSYELISGAAIKRHTIVNNKFKDSTRYFLVYGYGPGNACTTKKAFKIYEKAPDLSLKYKAIGASKCEAKDFEFDAVSEQCSACIYTWWDGNTIISNKKSFKHSFSSSGYHKIRVSAIDASGCSVMDQAEVEVKLSAAQFSIKSAITYKECPPARCKFYPDLKGFDSSRIESYLWVFGDGDSSVLKYPEHMYVNSGTYSIKLILTDDDGCVVSREFKDFISIDGPIATFKFPQVNACPPVNVEFKVSDWHNVKNAYIDYGDGNVEAIDSAGTYKHLYEGRPGIWYPSLIMTDPRGCVNTVRSDKSSFVQVYTVPKAAFEPLKRCSNEALSCERIIDESNWYEVRANWYVNHVFADSGDKLKGPLLPAGVHHVKLLTRSDKGCQDSSERDIRVLHIGSSLKKSADTMCIGESVSFKGFYESDTSLSSEEWYFDQVKVFSGSDWDTLFTEPGIRPLRYIVKNDGGCIAVASDKYGLIVGDTSAPAAPILRFVTVSSNQANEIYFDGNPGFDFRNYYLWDGESGELIDSIQNVNSTAFVRNSLKASEKSYCYKVSTGNLCYRTLKPDQLKKHCTVELQLRADTNRMLLKWNRYIGWDSVKNYRLERIDMNSQSNYSELAILSPEKLEYYDSLVKCFHTYSYRVAAVHPHKYMSNSDSAAATVIFKNFVPPIQPVLVSIENNEEVFLKFSPPHYLSVKPSLIYLKESSTASTTAQHYILDLNKDSVLRLPLKDYDRPLYYSTILENECREKGAKGPLCNSIFLQVSTGADNYPLLKWNHYQYWPEKVEKYLVERADGTGTFKEIAEVSGTKMEFSDSTIKRACYTELVYRVTAVPHICFIDGYQLQKDDLAHSNYVSYTGKPLVFIPSAFTPDKDYLNEHFIPSCNLCKTYTLKIFNRWGEAIYEVSSLDSVGWDGQYKGTPCADGVYVYLLTVHGLDERDYSFSGMFHLIR